MAVIYVHMYYKWPYICRIIYEPFPFQGPPKFTQIGIFSLKIYHLATLHAMHVSFEPFIKPLIAKSQVCELWRARFFLSISIEKNCTLASEARWYVKQSWTIFSVDQPILRLPKLQLQRQSIFLSTRRQSFWLQKNALGYSRSCKFLQRVSSNSWSSDCLLHVRTSF
jgi:hypothetical protein